jgi:hypothetical protein
MGISFDMYYQDNVSNSHAAALNRLLMGVYLTSSAQKQTEYGMIQTNPCN